MVKHSIIKNFLTSKAVQEYTNKIPNLVHHVKNYDNKIITMIHPILYDLFLLKFDIPLYIQRHTPSNIETEE